MKVSISCLSANRYGVRLIASTSPKCIEKNVSNYSVNPVICINEYFVVGSDRGLHSAYEPPGKIVWSSMCRVES